VRVRTQAEVLANNAAVSGVIRTHNRFNLTQLDHWACHDQGSTMLSNFIDNFFNPQPAGITASRGALTPALVMWKRLRSMAKSGPDFAKSF